MPRHIGWIVEAQIKAGRREDFARIVEEIVAATRSEGGTICYKYFVSDDGEVLVLEQFADIESANIHIDNWNRFAARWLEAAPATRMVHLGDLPDDLRSRHAALAPAYLKSFAGFDRRDEDA